MNKAQLEHILGFYFLVIILGIVGVVLVAGVYLISHDQTYAVITGIMVLVGVLVILYKTTYVKPSLQDPVIFSGVLTDTSYVYWKNEGWVLVFENDRRYFVGRFIGGDALLLNNTEMYKEGFEPGKTYNILEMINGECYAKLAD